MSSLPGITAENFSTSVTCLSLLRSFLGTGRRCGVRAILLFLCTGGLCFGFGSSRRDAGLGGVLGLFNSLRFLLPMNGLGFSLLRFWGGILHINVVVCLKLSHRLAASLTLPPAVAFAGFQCGNRYILIGITADRGGTLTLRLA